ncbi:PAM68 family protein [Cyanobium sp. FACHB-13342]|uniref:PAM68 family protein n=1 Tax=Cyanobium sp. FACHB-13342 TaxID=2692793 RepID=UPI001680F0AF|nr:PAM68 family protein [Cyanobium sp. FACHB-13342]MBD2423281.1 PAM68 family protein [Cyanobium sp. FACHB-13342]
MAGKGIEGRAPAGKAKRQPQGKPARPAAKQRSTGQQVIPDAVANRMARRIAIGTGIPTLMGMGVFVGSYLLVSRQIVEVPTGVTLAASGACFFLGVLGLSFGVLSASWEDKPGSLLGTEQIGVNISRLRSSIKSMRQGGTGPQS